MNNIKTQGTLWPNTGQLPSEAEMHFLQLGAMQNSMRHVPLDHQFAASLINLLNNGTPSGDRTGTGTLRHQSQYFYLDVSDNKIPALIGKKIHIEKIVIEAIWMFLGRTDIQFLNDRGVNYWNDWATPEGQLGPIYGHQMRNFAGIDQLTQLIDMIQKNPESRRLLMTLWNPVDLPQQKLPPCHLLYQVCVFQDPENGIPVMDLHVTQRSGDSFLGIPYDFVLFTTFFRIISEAVGLAMNGIHYTVADYHMYVNHEEAVRRYIENVIMDPKGIMHSDQPTMKIRQTLFKAGWTIDDLVNYLDTMEDDEAGKRKFTNIEISDYVSYPHIGAKIAV
jgi:thymidylate synthase